MASTVVDDMADALTMVETSLPSIDLLEPPNPKPPVRQSVSLAFVLWRIVGVRVCICTVDVQLTSKCSCRCFTSLLCFLGPQQEEKNTVPASAPASDHSNDDASPPGEGRGTEKGQGEETESESSTMTDEEHKVAEQAMQKATAAAGRSSPSTKDSTATDAAAMGQHDLPEPSLYSLVDMPLIAEVTTTVAALQYRLSTQQEYGWQSRSSWLWQALSGAPQLNAFAALRAAMMAPTTPTVNPLCCMGAMLCQKLYSHGEGSNGGDHYQQLLADSGSGAVLGVLSRPGRVLVTAQSDDDFVLSTAYLHDTLPSDGLVVLPEDGKVAGGAAATNWQLTVRSALRPFRELFQNTSSHWFALTAPTVAKLAVE